MELLLLLVVGAALWVLWRQSQGRDPTASAIGKVVAGCLGLGCLGALLLFAVTVAVLWLLLQALLDLDLSFSGLLDESGGGSGGEERERGTIS